MTSNEFRVVFAIIMFVVVVSSTSLRMQHGNNNGNGENSNLHNLDDEFNPEFLAPLENMTVTQGRDVVFTCVVNELGNYKVAWIKSDSKAILAIHTHMVALNQRLSVTHNGHNTWKLHIAHVQLNDSGTYMCQVNTDPMRSQSGHLNVTVSPDILNGPGMHGQSMLAEGSINEGGQTQLMCTATGVPEPTVQWRREGGQDIVLRSADGRDKQYVKFVVGERLVLQNVQRHDMGGYLCIASNGVPPSVSKRFDVQVMFPPVVKAVINLISSPNGSKVLLQCNVEVAPKSLNGWYRNEGNVELHDGPKYEISEGALNAFTWQMNLTIRKLQKHDFGSYVCSSANALGKHEDRIRINEIAPPIVVTTTALPFVFTTNRPPSMRRKQHPNTKAKGTGNGGLNANDGVGSVVRGRGHDVSNSIQEGDLIGANGSVEDKHHSFSSSRSNIAGPDDGSTVSKNSSGIGGDGFSSNGAGSGGRGFGGGNSLGDYDGDGTDKARNSHASSSSSSSSLSPSQTPAWVLLHSNGISNPVRGSSIIWMCGGLLLLVAAIL